MQFNIWYNILIEQSNNNILFYKSNRQPQALHYINYSNGIQQEQMNNIGGQELQQRKQKSIDSLLINICMMNFKQRKSRRITFSNIEGEIALIL